MFDGASVHGFDEGDVLEGILNEDPDLIFFVFKHNTTHVAQMLDNGVFAMLEKQNTCGVCNLLAAAKPGSRSIVLSDLTSSPSKGRSIRYNEKFHTTAESRSFGLVSENGSISNRVHIMINEASWESISVGCIQKSFEATGVYPFEPNQFKHLIQTGNRIEIDTNDVKKKWSEARAEAIAILTNHANSDELALNLAGGLIFKTKGIAINAVEEMKAAHEVTMKIQREIEKEVKEKAKKRKAVMCPGKQWKPLYQKGGLINAEAMASKKLDLVRELATNERAAAQATINDLKEIIQLLKGSFKELETKEHLTKKDASLKKRYEAAKKKLDEKVDATNTREKELRDEFERQREKLVTIALTDKNTKELPNVNIRAEELPADHPYKNLAFPAFNLDVEIPELRLMVKLHKRRRTVE
jgi:hypothetical protein